MNETTAVVAFNPRTVQQALHALKGTEARPEDEGLLRDLQQLAEALADLGCRGSATITLARARGVTEGPGWAVLKRAAKLFSEKQSLHPELARALELQADAIRKFAGVG